MKDHTILFLASYESNGVHGGYSVQHGVGGNIIITGAGLENSFDYGLLTGLPVLDDDHLGVSRWKRL